MSRLIPCSYCSDARAAGNAESALSCSRCDGKGFRRDPSSYLCNGCGGTMRAKDLDGNVVDSSEEGAPFGLVDAKVSGGYLSSWLSDGTSYTFSMCERCLRSLMGKMVVPPSTYSYIDGRAEEYQDDQDYLEDRLWEKNGWKAESFEEGICTKRTCYKPAKWRYFGSNSLVRDEARCDQHRKVGGYSAVPMAKLGTMQLDPERRVPKSEEDRLVVLEAWLPTAIDTERLPTFFYYAPDTFECFLVDDMRSIPGSCPYSAVWIPKGVEVHPALAALTEGMSLFGTPLGKVLVGICDRDRLRHLARAEREVVEADILPELHRAERAVNRAAAWAMAQPGGSSGVLQWPSVPVELHAAFGFMPEADDPEGKLWAMWVPSGVEVDWGALEKTLDGADERYSEDGILYLVRTASPAD